MSKIQNKNQFIFYFRMKVPSAKGQRYEEKLINDNSLLKNFKKK